MATDPGPFDFQLLAVDPLCAARRGQFRTPHGSVATPAFMPVGTQGTVKGLTIAQLRDSGAQMILGNAYHLALRPGDEVVRDLGGLHRFSGWNGPILTDSGGFQIFSLANQVRVTESGATFRSHLDGTLLELTPERAVAIQENLGSDVAMVLDHVVRLPAEPSVVRDACERSIRWAERCQAVARRPEQVLFAIVQGGLDLDLRVHCAQELRRLNFPGYAIGGLSVGESETEMHTVLDHVAPVLPTDRPRYLMGVGRPIDLLEGIRRGVDLFDCVLPTRNGRNALAFTDHGPIRLRNAVHQRDERPLESGCPCPACRHSRGYLRHLFIAGEMLGPILLTAHNLTFYQRLMQRAREAIEKGEFLPLLAECRKAWS